MISLTVMLCRDGNTKINAGININAVQHAKRIGDFLERKSNVPSCSGSFIFLTLKFLIVPTKCVKYGQNFC